MRGKVKLGVSDQVLMEAGDSFFWERFEVFSGKVEKRYTVINKNHGIILVDRAKLVKEKQKITI